VCTAEARIQQGAGVKTSKIHEQFRSSKTLIAFGKRKDLINGGI
jgi:hypothetical protein